jgi:hypothetical protein
MGRRFDLEVSVNGMSAIQNSPGWIVIVQTFVFGRITIQKRRVIANESTPGGRLRWANRDLPMAGTDDFPCVCGQTERFARLKLDIENEFCGLRFQRYTNLS